MQFLKTLAIILNYQTLHVLFKHIRKMSIEMNESQKIRIRTSYTLYILPTKDKKNKRNTCIYLLYHISRPSLTNY